MAGPMRLGLTGGIGSGKSTVAAVLSELGAAVVDADALAHAVTAPQGAAIAAIREAFGTEFLTPEGALDRARMRALAYSDANARQRLERIIHPLVGQLAQQQAREALAAGRRCVVLDIPLLAESGHWRARVDQVLVVDCQPETQVQRVMQRSALQRAEVERILASQASRLVRLRTADHVIYNDGIDLPQLRALVLRMAPRFGL
jgi:dephospho-CoA kinase